MRTSLLRKDVTAKCVACPCAGRGRRPFAALRTGISRKKKLLDKQQKGKTRMREYGNVSIPQEAFIAALRMGEE